MATIVKLLGNPVNLNFTGGITPKGAYAAGTTYATGESVSYNGSSYVAIQETTGNLPTNNTYWQVLAVKGDAGATGSPGADGADGTNGVNGVGVATGGTTGQILAKASSTDFDTKWVDNTGGSGISEAQAIAYSIAL